MMPCQAAVHLNKENRLCDAGGGSLWRCHALGQMTADGKRCRYFWRAAVPRGAGLELVLWIVARRGSDSL